MSLVSFKRRHKNYAKGKEMTSIMEIALKLKNGIYYNLKEVQKDVNKLIDYIIDQKRKELGLDDTALLAKFIDGEIEWYGFYIGKDGRGFFYGCDLDGSQCCSGKIETGEVLNEDTKSTYTLK